jgi:hypothetical protein
MEKAPGIVDLRDPFPGSSVMEIVWRRDGDGM